MGITTQDRIFAIQAIGKRWTALILDLESGPARMSSTTSVTTVTGAMAFWANPLLTEQTVQDLSVGLSAAQRALEQYECFGTWTDENADAMAGRTDEQRLDLLRDDVNVATYRLWMASEPCTACTRSNPADLATWLPQLHGGLCIAHHASVQTGTHLAAVAS